MIYDIFNNIISGFFGITLTYIYFNNKNTMITIDQNCLPEFYESYFEMDKSDFQDAILLKY